MKVLIGALLGIISPLLIGELTELTPWLATKLVRRAAYSLPIDYQERFAEEWARELQEVPGKLTKLAWAVKVAALAPSTRREIENRPPLWEELLQRAGGALEASSAIFRFLFRGTERAKWPFRRYHERKKPIEQLREPDSPRLQQVDRAGVGEHATAFVTSPRQEFADALKQRLIEHVLSYSSLARQLERAGRSITPQTISSWVQGAHIPRDDAVVLAIKEITDIPTAPCDVPDLYSLYLAAREVPRPHRQIASGS
jgi:hypothetical protein